MRASEHRFCPQQTSSLSSLVMRTQDWEVGLETIIQTNGKKTPNRQEADWHSEKLAAAEINFFLQEHVTHPTTHQ